MCWWFVISLGFYLSLTFTQFSDRKRKDFWQMFIHHALVLLLMSLSWVANLNRVGSLVYVVHDFACIFVDAWKCLKFANVRKATDVAYTFFIFAWIVSRLIIFPCIIVSSISSSIQNQQHRFPVFIILITLMIVILIIHCIWTHMIFQTIQQSRQSGTYNDIRSSSDDEVSADESELTSKNIGKGVVSEELHRSRQITNRVLPRRN